MESRMKLPLFDDFWIDFRSGTTRRWFAPELYSTSAWGCYDSLVYIPEKKVYRIYYEELITVAEDGPRLLKALESTDMKTFTQVYADDGSDVLYDGAGGVHGCSVLYDAYDPDPARRFKFCGMTRMKRLSCGTPITEVEIAFSADGIHWKNDHDLIAHAYTSDTLNKLVYNPLRKEYSLFFRSAFVDRRIAFKTSKDLKNWTEPRIILQPGPNYNDEHTSMQHYAMSASYQDGIFYGLLWRYNTNLYNLEHSRMFGYMEPELVYSYDGTEYLYTSGKPLMERPMPPAPGSVGLSPQDLCESADGQWYYVLCSGEVYVHGPEDLCNRLHETLREKNIAPANLIYRIRKDGFCGLESIEHGSLVVTKPIELLKDDLSFNIRADLGYVRFALMEKNGTFLEGFSFDDCIPFEYGDSVDVRPQWKNKKLSDALNRRVRVAVELNTAILHCISGTARPNGYQPQRSFADPQGL